MTTEGFDIREIASTVDVTGVPCPANAARVLLRLEGLDSGEFLEARVDDGEPVERLAHALEEDGHAVVLRERAAPGWRLVIRRE